VRIKIERQPHGEKMKIKALTTHQCLCCGKPINKGDECYVFFNLPKNPEEAEYEPFYIHIRCIENSECARKVARTEKQTFARIKAQARKNRYYP
jgi:hypothetical protein